MIDYYHLLEGVGELRLGQGPPSTLEYWMGPNSVREVLNTNFGLFKDFVNVQEASVEQSNALLFGSSVYSGMTPAAGSGLSIDVSAGYALIGFLIEYEGGSIVVPANYNPGYIFFCQDGTWHVDDDNTSPEDTENFLFASFVSDTDSIVSVDATVRTPYQVLPCQLKSAIGSFDAVVPVNGPLEVEVTHSISFTIPGFISLTSSSGDIDVEHCYPELDTPTTFWVRMQFNKTQFYSDYADNLEDITYGTDPYYASEETTISWVRTGLGYT